MAGERVLVVGCGGIGGIIAAHLIERGHDISVLTTNPAIARALRERGLEVRGQRPLRVPAPRVLEAVDDAPAPFDVVLLATQPPDVEQAARRAAPLVADRGAWVVLQNGLCEERLAALFGPDRIIGAVVGWGASMIEPGVYDRTSSGGFCLGRLDGRLDDRTERVARLLEAVGPVARTRNLRGVRWSKLAVNCAISTLGTVSGQSLGELLGQRIARRLALETISEVVEVAGREGVRLERLAKTPNVGWLKLAEPERRARFSPRLVAKHAVLIGVGSRYRRLRSSMLAAIERGRRPAVDFLNGEVVERADRHGLGVPVNRAAREIVWAIAEGRQRSGRESLLALYDRTRPLLEPAR